DIRTIPKDIENLVKAAIETGAALAGTLQTENIGIEKIVANIASNPNIRYLILCGEEVAGHRSGDALRALIKNGVDEKRTIIGTEAPTPYLFNIPLEAIERFRNQITLVDLLGEVDQKAITKAVWSCYQENPTRFRDYTLSDPGAYCDSAKSFRLTMRVTHPEEIERWELDEVVKNLESAVKVEEKKSEVVEKAKIKEGITRGISEEKFVAIGKHLAKISEELSGIARILIGQELIVKEKEEAVPEVAVRPRVPPKEEVLTEEEKMAVIYFENRLRVYSGILAVFSALKNDMCGGGLNLPVSVNSAIKKLKKLKKELDKSSISKMKKEEIGWKIDEFLKQTEELPTDPGPCQKTAGNCKLGQGCFSVGALDMLKLMTEQTS
ncbi:MAG: tetrahydromethanopterin S-methyltransferase subunit A, partial [Candidatus Bathyarchaeia archaeon]